MRYLLSTTLVLLVSLPSTASAEPPMSIHDDPAPVLSGAVTAEAEDTPTARAVMVLTRFAHEPSVLQVQDAASRHAMVHPDTYKNWLSRAAWSGALPDRLIGLVQHTTDNDTNVRTATLTGSQTETLDLDAQLRYSVYVRWDLSRLIFDKNEYNAAKELSKIVTRREDLLTTVNKLYFARRQLQAMAVLSPAKSAQKALKHEIRLAGLTADLDALTGGWFSREVTSREAKKQQEEASRTVRP